jgi:hypothetical protein
MLLVEIEKPENQTLGAWFCELRNWFDVNRCEPSAFTLAGRRVDRLIYRVSFENSNQAHAFAETFARYSPTVRRASTFERTQPRTIVPPVKVAS